MSVPAGDFRLRPVATSRGPRWTSVGGQGPVLLYLHGVGDTGSINPLLRRLAGRYTVVRPDHPGFLGTRDLGCTSVADLADHHADLLGTLLDSTAEDGPVVVVGSSFGGWVAAELGLRAPALVAELVLIDPAGLAGPDAAPNLFTLDPATMVRRSFHRPDLKAAAESLDDATCAVLRGNLEAARRVAPTLSDPALAERLASLTTPTTVVWGAEDEVFPVSYVDEWRRALSGARIEVIEGAGHLPHVERLDDFLARTPLTPSR